MYKLPELLKRLRRARGYSLRQVEQLTNGMVTHGYIHTLERGYEHQTGKPVMPSPRVLKILSEVYDYPYEELLRAAGYLPPAAPETFHLEDILKHNYVYFENRLLTRQDKEDLLNILSPAIRAMRKREKATRHRLHRQATARIDYYDRAARRDRRTRRSSRQDRVPK
ncbi:MAG: helix-turn-helix transcriptional regulator [Bacillota bacterium]